MRSSSYTFRPLGELAAYGSGLLLVLLGGIAATLADSLYAGETSHDLPTLKLSVAGDFQQAVHLNYDLDRDELYRQPSLVAPLHPVEVAPHEWMKIYTSSPLSLPRSARAWVYESESPEPCFGNVMIGCVEVDLESRGRSIPLHPGVAGSFGFAAPSAPGSYWIALDAAWGFGGGTQVFLIDVRA